MASETIEDIVRKMREHIGNGLCLEFADRIEAAANNLEINRMADIARECAKVKAECDSENARLRAALKPVIDVKLPESGAFNCDSSYMIDVVSAWNSVLKCQRIFKEIEAK